MNDTNSTEQTWSTPLTDDELALIAGGDTQFDTKPPVPRP
jgi:hypothetical protein